MSTEEKMRLVVALDTMINRKIPGNANEYAGKLRISRRAFFRLIDFMKTEMAAPIVHDKIENRFKYSLDGKLYFGFVATSPLGENEIKKVNGGTISYTTFLIRAKNLFRVPTTGTLGDYV